ncbi:MAG: hypothetical protein ABIW84_05675 [Ilumatobacteraceae bacterium]
METETDVGMFGPAVAPLQDSPLHRPQCVGSGFHTRARNPRIFHDPIDELRLAPEAAGDLDVVDAIGHEAKDATLERPQ